MSKRFKDVEFQEYLFLGGKISGVHTEYKELARMNPEIARVYLFLENLDELLKEEDALTLTKKLVHIFGVTEGMKGMSEITRLSMILGDTRKGKSLKSLAKKMQKK